MAEEKEKGIFQKFVDLTSVALDAKIVKAKSDLTDSSPNNSEEDIFYAKSLLEDPSYAVHSSGWREKPHRLQNGHLKMMSLKSSVVSAIILTRQNQASMYSRLSASGNKKGWRIVLKDEALLVSQAVGEAKPKDDESQKDWSAKREALHELRQKHSEARIAVERYMSNCGHMDEKPFQAKKWGLDATLRAWIRDSLTYDFYASEIVKSRDGKPHHFVPVDGGTIKYASPSLKYSPQGQGSAGLVELEILYPEKEAKKIADSGITELDPKKMDDGDYRYVQVIRGRVERAFTEHELKVGIRNPTTDIYNNGYGIAELELAVGLITGHLNAEFYNQAYFTQGFSAKGILHIKSNINHRKLESVRQQWQHMLKGSRNSFQTPIFAGVDEVDWIKLDQKHEDIGFESWLRYLVKMICAIYQIDPQEIGIGFKEEGGSSGGGLSGDNTDQKIKQSQERGLFPLLRHIQAYINNNILTTLDDRFCFEFTGLTTETEEERVKRLEKLSTFAMDINEIRDELDLEAFPGADMVVQSTEYMKWYFANKMGLVPAGYVDPALEMEKIEEQSKNSAADQAKTQAPTKENSKVEKAFPLKIEYFNSDS